MHISELVGKKAMRTKPLRYDSGTNDYSFCSDPIEVLKVTEHHIYMKTRHYESVLDVRWIDDNWVEYDNTVFDEPVTTEEITMTN